MRCLQQPANLLSSRRKLPPWSQQPRAVPLCDQQFGAAQGVRISSPSQFFFVPMHYRRSATCCEVPSRLSRGNVRYWTDHLLFALFNAGFFLAVYYAGLPPPQGEERRSILRRGWRLRASPASFHIRSHSDQASPSNCHSKLYLLLIVNAVEGVENPGHFQRRAGIIDFLCDPAGLDEFCFTQFRKLLREGRLG